MLILFEALFAVAILTAILFFMTLADDIQSRSLRPFYFLFIILVFWSASMPALLTPDQAITSIPTYNTIINSTSGGTWTNTIIQTPHFNTTFYQNQPFPISTLYTYLTVWGAIEGFFMFILIMLVINRLRTTAEEAFK